MNPSQILHRHFFRRFFDNDTLSLEGETETVVIRALALCAVPALMVAFWLLPSYPGRDIPGVVFGRDPWAITADRYFFVLYSFFVMGTVATFEWQMLFPDRADFLILLPLPLKPSQLFLAKGRALLSFLGLFLIATNGFALIFYTAVSTRAQQSYFHTVVAHFCAVMLAGIFAAFTMLALAGLALCILPPSWFQIVSTILQCFSIAALLLFFLLFPLAGTHMKMLLSGQSHLAQFIPPLWFLGIYLHLVSGPSVPPAAAASAAALSAIGLYATAISVSTAILTYPLAWARQKKRALEGATEAKSPGRKPLSHVLHRTFLVQPQARAVFHFITQTVTRNTHYQAYLAIYAGAGLALALASILTLRVPSSTHIAPHLAVSLSAPGLHALLPLLLFWLVAGLRSAFSFPVDMRARWIFPINLPLAGETFQRAVKAARLWVMLCCTVLTGTILLLLLILKWPWWHLGVQAVWGMGLSTVLTNFFFVGRTQIPFTRPRLPGRAGLPLTLTIYAALFPALVLLTVNGERLSEVSGKFLVEVILTFALIRLALHFADRLAQKGIIGGFPEDEGDPGPQDAGLAPIHSSLEPESTPDGRREEADSALAIGLHNQCGRLTEDGADDRS